MTGTCKDCRHWQNKSTCGLAEFVEKREKLAGDAFGVYAGAADDTNLEFDLKTGPLFGCVKFEPKKKRKEP